MYSVLINNNTYEVDFSDTEMKFGKVNGNNFELDQVSEKNTFHIIYNNRSFSVNIIKFDSTEKKITLNINNRIIEASVSDDMDKMIKKMGFKQHSVEKSMSLKAPMPGLVTDIKVNQGDSIEKGDSLVVLEAMKMENNLKAENDSRVKEVIVKKGSSVEKNEVLIIFE